MRGVATFYHAISARSIPGRAKVPGKKRPSRRLGGKLASTTESTAIVSV
jgi:hypothetical protein